MATSSIPLPKNVVAVIEEVHLSERHPGLQLDKYLTPAGTQELQKEALKSVLETACDRAWLQSARQRREQMLQRLGAVQFRATTAGPLTLHLARASVLENAGICLHAIYGFVYFPGTGLKGMARAYAETVWLPMQPNQTQARRQIEDVFGWAVNPERQRQVRDQQHPAAPRREDEEDSRSAEIRAAAGNIVFHDAWPVDWPKLRLDIVNNHHTEYYRDERVPPGDWEDPEMVYFLAIGPGETFDFALSKRRSDTPDPLLQLARQWLIGALTREGLGAKTAAGYGAFVVDFQAAIPTPQPPVRAVFETTLELVTPAFLAGPHQQKEDCDLRPATLRGLLRWWWRTMHAGYVDVPTLHRLEAAVWGDTNTGGPVRITVSRRDPVPVERFEYKRDSGGGKSQLQPDRKALIDLGIIPLTQGFTTQWLFYAAYGMDEISHGQRRSRYWVRPPAEWTVRMVAGPGKFTSNGHAAVSLPTQAILQQAQAALWLLCQYGGVGSRCRKGFGSLKDVNIDGISSLEDVERVATQFRSQCELVKSDRGKLDVRSPSLAACIVGTEFPLPWKNPYRALDEVAQAYEAAALAPPNTGHGKHCEAKLGLGLPRQIHGPRPRPLAHQRDHKPPVRLKARGPDGKYLERHASPLFFHFATRQDGTLSLRVIGFPSAVLGGLATNRQFLEKKFLPYFESTLKQRAEKGPRDTQPRPGSLPSRPSPECASSALPKANDRVPAVLLEEKTKKGGWKARLAQGNATPGAISNTADVPASAAPGQEVTLIIHSINAAPDGSIRAIQFRWPTDKQG